MSTNTEYDFIKRFKDGFILEYNGVYIYNQNKIIEGKTSMNTCYYPQIRLDSIFRTTLEERIKKSKERLDEHNSFYSDQPKILFILIGTNHIYFYIDYDKLRS